MKLIDALNWRYAAKRMNGEVVPAEKMEAILEATRLSASSMGLQPYTIIVVENADLKKRLHPAALGQPQILESSHLLVFAAWTDVTEAHIDDYIADIVQTRQVPAQSLDAFRSNMLGFVNNRSTAQKHDWAARQAYIAFGTAIAAAAMERVDATPMEGFDPAAVDEILGLSAKGLRSVTMLALGYRDAENDILANQKKVRRAKEALILKAA